MRFHVSLNELVVCRRAPGAVDIYDSQVCTLHSGPQDHHNIRFTLDKFLFNLAATPHCSGVLMFNAVGH